MEKLFSKPIIIVVIVAAITLFLGIQLPKVQLDNNNLRFLPEKNEAKVISEYIDKTFGGQVIILVGLERPFKSVFEKDFLAQIREFSDAVENLELIKSVNSVMSTQYITGDSESIIVTDLVPEDFTGTKEEIAELKRRIASWDLFRGSLVSDDLSATQILITLEADFTEVSTPEITGIFKNIRRIAGEIFTEETNVYYAGQTVINALINESIIEDNVFLLPLAVVVVLALLFFSFRRLIFVVLPISTALLSVIWTVGLAAMFGVRLSTITTIMPIILVAVGHAYGIHVITHYVKDIREKILSIEEHRRIVFELMRKMIKPVFLAAITTVTGFVSFCFTPIVPMREFGYYTSVGVFSVFLLTIFFVPAILLLRGPKKAKTENIEQENKKTDDFLSNKIADFFLGIARKKKTVIFSTFLIILISIYGISKVVVDNSVIDFFQDETDVSRSDRFIREYFGGAKDLSLVVLADTTEELLHPDVLTAIDGLSAYLIKNVPEVGKAVGFTDIIKRINQVFNADQSPDGLQSVTSGSSSDFGGFGFDSSDGFGFGGFGFDDFGFNNESASTNENSNNLPDPVWSQYDAADLLKFFDITTGVSPNMNGNELVLELKRLTNYDGMAYYEIPSDPERYGKLTSDDLQKLVAN